MEVEYEKVHAKTLQGWSNYDSAEQEQEELLFLVQGYVERGFCHIKKSIGDAEQELGRAPIINKLGVIKRPKSWTMVRRSRRPESSGI